MLIHIISVGNKMPEWICHGFEDYLKRLPKQIKIELFELSPTVNKNSELTMQAEASKIVKALTAHHQLVLLDIHGKSFSSQEFAQKIGFYIDENCNLDIVIGGAFGVAPEIKALASERWSLGTMTLPHMLARIILVEQIYRAWSILSKHPYHK